ncbi:hypothetical protein [Salipaludibacillus daqingensis]|uniref:hypothetical protein n=1 Tax=Salipaludibacillus daqingensis TaxID=3041001 RepID=UPI0024744977|nr:hypothetical protein [Salipaludibacillus daqingensis]
MGQLLTRAIIFCSILMFGFILGILYSDQDVDFTSERFHLKKEEPSTEQRFKVKDNQPHIIEMEEDEGLVVYQEGNEEIHEFLEEQLPTFIDKSTESNQESSPLFSEIGLRTAGAFETVFQKMFSVIDGN